MDSYERVMCCLQHREPDRLPVNGTFHPETWQTLTTHFGTEDREAILRLLGIDLREMGMGLADGFRARATFTHDDWWIVHPDGSLEDEWGVRIHYESQGRYYNYVHQPLADETQFESYQFPDLDAPGRFQSSHVGEKAFAYMAGHSNLYKACWHLRGVDQWMMDLLINVDFAEALLDCMLAWQLEWTRRIVPLGPDIIRAVGDISMQDRMLIRPEVWRRLFKPREAVLIEEARRLGAQHFFFHSDGDMSEVMDDLVEIGFDIIDPIQPECMDPAAIKQRYGDRITLHGTISCQQTLPFGSVEDVHNEVRLRMRTCGYDGGFIVAPSNIVQPDVPLGNLLALYDTVKGR